MSQPYVTPLVRMLAAERGVDLTQVVGTGVGGRICKADVLNAAPAGGPRVAVAQSGGVVRTLQIAPRNRAEAEAMLGPRPGSDWFAGYPTGGAMVQAQAEWDAEVRKYETYEDVEEAAARGIMNQYGGLTFEQALAEVRSRGGG